MPLPELLLVLALGLAFGSFVTCMSYRLPLGQDVVKKPSFCPTCSTTLKLPDLFPLFSWLAARGTCRYCKTKISVRYPLTELVTALLFFLAYARYGMSWPLLPVCLMAVMLMIMIVVDLEHFIIPDSVHVVLLPLGLLYHYFMGSAWDEVAIGFGALLALGLFLHYGYSAWRGQVMLGFGDVKFFAVAGLWLGPWLSVPFLFLSGVLGVVLGLIWRALGKGEIFPFGPALALSLFICVVYSRQVNMLYHMQDMLR